MQVLESLGYKLGHLKKTSVLIGFTLQCINSMTWLTKELTQIDCVNGIRVCKRKHESVYTFILSRNDQNIRFNFWTSIISNISVSRRQAEDVHDGNRTENMASRVRKKASSCLARKETKFRKTRQLSKNDSVSLDHRLPLIQ